jgi:hypothetical protein
MKIVFLDIDGTICTDKSYTAYATQGMMFDWDDLACKFLKTICEKSNTKIVISSSWRVGESNQKDLHKQLQKYGLEEHLHEDKYTRCFSCNRGEEIQDWLKRNGHEEYVILDDREEMLPEQEPFFIMVDPIEGLTFSDYNKILEILNVDCY